MLLSRFDLWSRLSQDMSMDKTDACHISSAGILILGATFSFVGSRYLPKLDTWTSSLVEQTEAHVLVFGLFLLLFLGGLLWCLGSTARSGGGNWSGRSVVLWVLDAVLELGDGLPLVLGLESDGDDVLVAVDKRVHDRWQGWVVEGEGDGRDRGDGGAEGLEELGLLDVENAHIEGLTLVVDLGNTHTVREGRDVQHVEQGSLGGTDLAAGLDELEIGGNFNGTTGDLGWDTESLEERSLSGLHTGVSSWNVDIGRGDGTSTGWSSDTVGENLLTGGLEVGVGEDKTDVALDVWEKTFVLGRVGHEGLERTADLEIIHQNRVLHAHIPNILIPWCSCPSRQPSRRAWTGGSRASAATRHCRR